MVEVALDWAYNMLKKSELRFIKRNENGWKPVVCWRRVAPSLRNFYFADQKHQE